jgi:hypothetical protein
MKRRIFLKNSSLAGAAGVLSDAAVTLQAGAQNARKKPAPGAPADPGRILNLNCEYYCHYPVDFSRGKEGALGFRGWGKSVEISVPAEESALILMHIWNVGMTPELAWKADGPSGGVMLMAEWAARTVPMIRRDIPPIIAAARKARLPIIHIASSEHYANKYPGYRASLAVAGAEPPGPQRAPRDGEPKSPDDRKSALLFGERFPASEKFYELHIDFPDEAKPLEHEPVVVTTHQFNAVLRDLGI